MNGLLVLKVVKQMRPLFLCWPFKTGGDLSLQTQEKYSGLSACYLLLVFCPWLWGVCSGLQRSSQRRPGVLPRAVFPLQCCRPLACLPLSPLSPGPPASSDITGSVPSPAFASAILSDQTSLPSHFHQGPTQSHPWGKLVRVPSPLASLRTLLFRDLFLSPAS